MSVRRVAVLGAGIMGCSTALFLARRGVRVALFDAAPAPFCGASRWNEGKIHLGHLYAADPSMRTARRLAPGGLAFKPLVESLIGESIDPAVTREDDVYLTHRESAVDADSMGRYFDAATRAAAEHPDRALYLADLTGARARRLTAAELERVADPAHVVAGFRVPERSVSTAWLADRFVAAVEAEPGIESRMGVRALSVRSADGSLHAPLAVATASGVEGPFDAVVNALWEGRPAIDRSVGLPKPPLLSHRYRLAVFLRTREAVDVESAVVALGPFGDVKNYGGRDFYVSWYPTGLVAEGVEIDVPEVRPLPEAERRRIGERMLAEVARCIPRVADLAAACDTLRVEGGWVYADGRGSLADPAATIHRRDRIGVERRGAYVSVDTGKYSVAPLFARDIAAMLLGG